MRTRYTNSPLTAARRSRRSPLRRILTVRNVVVLVVIAVGFYSYTHQPKQQAAKSPSDIKTSTVKTKTTKLSKGTPDYATLLPSGKSIGDYGGWTRVSPSSADPVYAYVDTIDGISINISQQPVPTSFIGNIDKKVEELAQDYSAGQKISTKDVTVYVGTSSSGPESIIFVKGDTLILMKTDSKISNNSLLRYIESLQSS